MVCIVVVLQMTTPGYSPQSSTRDTPNVQELVEHKTLLQLIILTKVAYVIVISSLFCVQFINFIPTLDIRETTLLLLKMQYIFIYNEQYCYETSELMSRCHINNVK